MKSLRTYISAMLNSLYSRGFYFSIFRDTQISAIKYILFLCLLVSIPLSLQVKYLLNLTVSDKVGFFGSTDTDEIAEEVNFLNNQMPQITYEKNSFFSSSDKPEFIKSRSDNVLAVVDTSRQFNNYEMLDNAAILKDNEFILISGGKLSGSIPAGEAFSSFQNYFYSNHEDIQQFDTKKFFRDLLSIVKTPVLVIYVFCFLWLGIKYFFSIIFYSFISGIFMGVMLKNFQFDFKLCMRIAAFTITPVAILEVISFMIGGGLFAYANLVYFVTHVLYIYFAVESFRARL